MSVFDDLFERIAKMRAVLAGKPDFEWAIVKNVSPIMIRLENTGHDIPISSTLIGGLIVNDRVMVMIQRGRVTIIGGGSNFMSGSTILAPVGAVFEWYSSTTPAGYLRLEGQAVSRTTYSVLFSLWGTTFGSGDGSTTFNLPDRRGRVSVGVSTDTEFNALGKKFGTKTHTLTVAEMPSHDHRTLSSGDPWVYKNAEVLAGGSPHGGQTVTNQRTGETGSGQAHNNIQPSIATYFIVRAL